MKHCFAMITVAQGTPQTNRSEHGWSLLFRCFLGFDFFRVGTCLVARNNESGWSLFSRYFCRVLFLARQRLRSHVSKQREKPRQNKRNRNVQKRSPPRARSREAKNLDNTSAIDIVRSVRRHERDPGKRKTSTKQARIKTLSKLTA